MGSTTFDLSELAQRQFGFRRGFRWISAGAGIAFPLFFFVVFPVGSDILKFFQTGSFDIGHNGVNLVVIAVVAYVEILMLPGLYQARYGPVRLAVDDEALRLIYRNGRVKVFWWSDSHFHMDLYDIRHLTDWIQQLKPLCLAWIDQWFGQIWISPEALDYLVDSAKSHGLDVTMAHPSVIKRFSTKFILPKADIYKLRAGRPSVPLPP